MDTVSQNQRCHVVHTRTRKHTRAGDYAANLTDPPGPAGADGARIEIDCVPSCTVGHPHTYPAVVDAGYPTAPGHLSSRRQILKRT